MSADDARSAYYTAESNTARLTDGEAAIAQDAYYSYLYLTRILRVEMDEGLAKYRDDSDTLQNVDGDDDIKAIYDSVIGDATYACMLVRHLGVVAFPELEEIISTDADASFCYAKEILKERFIKGEAAIAQHAHLSYLYSRDVLHGRFSLGEKAVQGDREIYELYEEYNQDLL